MLHCPRNIMRTVAYSVCLSWRPALLPRWPRIRPAIGESRTASPTSGLPNATAACGARCHGRRRPAAATRTIPMPRNRTGRRWAMPILIDMKKKPGVDQWEGQGLQRQGRPDVQRHDQAARLRSARDPGLRAGLSVRRRNLDPRRGPDSLEPRQQHGQGRAEDRRAPPRDGCAVDSPPPAAAPKTTGSISPAPKAGQKQAAGQPGDIGDICLLPDHRAVCPLAPAGTTAPRPAW